MVNQVDCDYSISLFTNEFRQTVAVNPVSVIDVHKARRLLNPKLSHSVFCVEWLRFHHNLRFSVSKNWNKQTLLLFSQTEQQLARNKACQEFAFILNKWRIGVKIHTLLQLRRKNQSQNPINANYWNVLERNDQITKPHRQRGCSSNLTLSLSVVFWARNLVACIWQ